MISKHCFVIECDEIIYSLGESNGTVMSPYYPDPYPLNIICTYFIDGLQDRQNLEKVILNFEDLDIPHEGPGFEYRRVSFLFGYLLNSSIILEFFNSFSEKF